MFHQNSFQHRCLAIPDKRRREHITSRFFVCLYSTFRWRVGRQFVMEEKIKNFETFSNGFVKNDFIFEANSLTYVERSMHNPMDSCYHVSVCEEKETNAEVIVTLSNGYISIEITNLQLDNGYFPNFICSKLNPLNANVSENVSKKPGEDFRVWVIGLPDMRTNRSSAHIDLLFKNRSMCGINIELSNMDDNYQINETILNLYGGLYSYLHNNQTVETIQ